MKKRKGVAVTLREIRALIWAHLLRDSGDNSSSAKRDQWKCKYCGNVNQRKVGRCRCGVYRFSGEILNTIE
ncbi:MAG: hypothetical protein HY093_00820 [Candidatus Liptonbacteria bacterium]|nr:hypothetical protein [Candidatus Liptonbacteria bacterium]